MKNKSRFDVHFLSKKRKGGRRRDGRMAKRTRIVCTLGPAVDSESTLRNLIVAGMDVARVDASMGSSEQIVARIQRLKKVRQELDACVAVMLDTRGPEIRTGSLAGGRSQVLRAGDHFTLTEREVAGTDRIVSQSCAGLAGYVRPGTTILLDAGRIELAVDEAHAGEIECTVQTSGVLRENVLVNLPGTTVPLPILTDGDRRDIIAALREGVDFVAASFVRTAEDVRRVRMFLDANEGTTVRIVAKIETADAFENLEEVVDAADAVMVSRGILGLEMTPYDIPHVQKQIIRECNHRHKPVVIATQMLDSMCRSPTPTRAEVGDVANAIYDGADALMLTDETATGLYPAPAVQTMARIAEATEQHLYLDGAPVPRSEGGPLVAPSVVMSAVRTAESVGAACIITPTTTGRTARLVSKLRPRVPIFAVASTPEVMRSMQLYWGVIPALGNAGGDIGAIVADAERRVLRAGLAAVGDIAVVTGGDRATSPHLDRRFAGEQTIRAEADPSTFAPTNVMYVVELADAGSERGNE